MLSLTKVKHLTLPNWIFTLLDFLDFRKFFLLQRFPYVGDSLFRINFLILVISS